MYHLFWSMFPLIVLLILGLGAAGYFITEGKRLDRERARREREKTHDRR